MIAVGIYEYRKKTISNLCKASCNAHVQTPRSALILGFLLVFARFTALFSVYSGTVARPTTVHQRYVDV